MALCVAIQKNGINCSAKAKPGTEYCGRHRFHILQQQPVADTINEPEIQEEVESVESNVVPPPEDLEAEQLQRDLEAIADMEALDAVKTCHCCYMEPEEGYKLIKCSRATASNQHLVCPDCLQGSVKAKISEGISTHECVFEASDKCGGTYPEAIFSEVLDADTLAKFIELVEVRDAATQATKLDNYQLCPFCSRYGCVINPTSSNDKIYTECPKCSKSWCSTCRREEHGTRHCYELDFKLGITLRDRCNMVDRMIHEIMTNQTAHKCPKCKFTFIKEEGCNKITCSKCNSYSCYVCGKEIPKEVGYSHFGASKGLCSLYNQGEHGGGNVQYTRSQIHRELETFISKNDPAFKRIIIGRIENYYKMEKSKEAVEFIKRLLESLKKEINDTRPLDSGSLNELSGNSRPIVSRGKARILSPEDQAKEQCIVS